MKLTYSIKINSNIDTVFSYLQDPQKQKLWVVGMVDRSTLKKQKFDKGEPFLLKMGKGIETKEYKGYMLINQYPTYQHFTIEIELGKLYIDNIYLLQKTSENTTKLNYIADYRIKNLSAKILMIINYPLFYIPFIKTSIAGQLKKLKKLAEEENI
ncbi:MAG: SRPBCC family protein [Alphaproteobacteria bacterium]|jgi:hypothetical protein|nr:SRPBCC family protein [Alphaproteobacteria bacterium]